MYILWKRDARDRPILSVKTLNSENEHYRMYMDFQKKLVQELMTIQMSERFKSKYKFCDPADDFLDDIRRISQMNDKLDGMTNVFESIFLTHDE